MPSSTIAPPPAFFHALATSSHTSSASPSSRHREPQYFPTNVASSCSVGPVIVRLCFFVKTRNVMGRSMVGGMRIGRIVAALPPSGVADARCLRSGKGRAGVAKPGEEENASGAWELSRCRKIEGVFIDMARRMMEFCCESLRCARFAFSENE